MIRVSPMFSSISWRTHSPSFLPPGFSNQAKRLPIQADAATSGLPSPLRSARQPVAVQVAGGQAEGIAVLVLQQVLGEVHGAAGSRRVGLAAVRETGRRGCHDHGSEAE